MMKNRSLKIFLLFVFAIFFSVNTGWTQQLPVEPSGETSDIEVNDRMIEQFASATEVLNVIQKDGQVEMIDAIDQQGLTLEEFNQMVNMEEYPDGEETKAISREDKIAFDNAKKQVDQVRSNVEQRMDEAIMKAGLTLEEYQAVKQAYNEDADVRKRIDSKVDDGQ